MSGAEPDQPAPVPAAAPIPRPQTQRFRRAMPAVRLTADQQRRQSSVTTAAWQAWNDRERAIAFLNASDDQLGARPLDLAIESDAGLEAALARLEAIRAGTPA